MNPDIEVQYAIDAQDLPQERHIQNWINTALAAYPKHYCVCVRIVDSNESQALNSQYRGKDKATNVLSFPFEMPEFIDAETEILGDLVICAAIVEQEAKDQKKQLFDHWAHMIVHGTLHLLGFDHIEELEALEMEQLEREILASLAIADPYTEV